MAMPNIKEYGRYSNGKVENVLNRDTNLKPISQQQSAAKSTSSFNIIPEQQQTPPQQAVSSITPIPQGDVPQGNITNQGATYAKNVMKDLTQVNSNVESARQQAQRRGSAREYAARLQARESAGAQGFGAGTAQASRLQAEGIAPALKANMQEQANINDQQRQYYDKAMDRATGIETDAQNQANIDWTNANTEKVQDESSAMMYINGIQDPVTKQHMLGKLAEAGGDINKFREAMLDINNAPKMKTPTENDIEAFNQQIMAMPESPDGDPWLTAEQNGGIGEQEEYAGKMYQDMILGIFDPITDTANDIKTKQAQTRFDKAIQNNQAPTLQDLNEIRDPLTTNDLAKMDTKKSLDAWLKDNPDGYANIGGDMVEVVGQVKTFGNADNPGDAQWIVVKHNGKEWSYSDRRKAWVEGRPVNYQKYVKNTSIPWQR